MFAKHTKPHEDHADHPAFLRVLDGLRDPATEWFILRVEYGTDHPDYEGGVCTEIYDSNGECIDDHVGDGELQTLLASALGDFEVEPIE